MAALKAKEKNTTLQKGTNRNSANFALPEIGRPKSQMVAEKKERRLPRLKPWLSFLDEEHTSAIISDAFWYVICKLCNPKVEFK